MDKKKSHGKDLQKELDILLSRINALEASSSDKQQKSLCGILKIIVENQKHTIGEFDHLKKAIDLVTLQVFKLEQEKR